MDSLTQPGAERDAGDEAWPGQVGIIILDRRAAQMVRGPSFLNLPGRRVPEMSTFAFGEKGGGLTNYRLVVLVAQGEAHGWSAN